MCCDRTGTLLSFWSNTCYWTNIFHISENGEALGDEAFRYGRKAVHLNCSTTRCFLARATFPVAPKQNISSIAHWTAKRLKESGMPRRSMHFQQPPKITTVFAGLFELLPWKDLAACALQLTCKMPHAAQRTLPGSHYWLQECLVPAARYHPSPFAYSLRLWKIQSRHLSAIVRYPEWCMVVPPHPRGGIEHAGQRHLRCRRKTMPPVATEYQRLCTVLHDRKTLCRAGGKLCRRAHLPSIQFCQLRQRGRYPLMNTVILV